MPHKTGGMACVNQLLDFEIPVGQRNNILWLTYNLLCKHNEPNYAETIIREKNASLKNPQSEALLNTIFEKSYLNIGCDYVKSIAPFVSCDGCKVYKKKENKIFKDEALQETLKDCTPATREVYRVITLKNIKDTFMLQDLTGLSRPTIIKAKKVLHEKGLINE